MRITVPSVEKIMRCDDQDYYQFTTKFHHQGATKRGAMYSILYCHGHKTAWTASLLETSLFYVGFEDGKIYEPRKSDRPELLDVEGHHKVIGDRFNSIESICFEGTKPLPVNFQASNRVAVVVGGGPDVKAELEQARQLCAEAQLAPRYFVINAMIPLFDGEMTAISLHPDKFEIWLKKREKNGHPKPQQIWAHRPHRQIVTNVTGDLHGSSGLFAFKVARELGFERVILCGVPMNEDKHFERQEAWRDCKAFRRTWETHKDWLMPYVRSFSGWTAETFGKPTVDFIMQH